MSYERVPGAARPILFIGDSITDSGRLDDPPYYLGDGYVRMIAQRLPDGRVINVGISGNRVVDLRDRWSIDVVSQFPDVLSVYVGINDTWRRYDENNATTAANFERDYRACLSELGGAVLLVLMEPFVVPVFPEQEHWHEDLDPKRAVVAKLAAEFEARFVPLQSLMSAAAEEHGAAAIAQDGVHPTELGHRIIADAWLEAAGL
ncbi:MAG TPA: SGNH/GDSL hydrolase family protein [Galbitalea sp.]|jgi:lysophospholipase L1-like esterase|nr:SGNH/GDSL hydrolase family protein [Galbitalea sp.]